MTRRPIAALVITALLGAQPGAPALAGEVAKTLPAGPNAPVSAVPTTLPNVSLKLSASLGAGLDLPGAPLAGIAAAPGGPAAASQTALKAGSFGVPAPAARAANPEAALVAGALTAQAAFASAPNAQSPQAPAARASRASSIREGLGKLAGLFTGKKDAKKDQAEGGDALRGFFDGDPTKVFLTEHGREPSAGELSSLPKMLEADPRYAAKLAKSGRVRIVVDADTGRPQHAAAIAAQLGASGVSSKINVEKIIVRRASPAGGAAGADWTTPAQGEAFWKKALLAGPRELAYIAKTFKASITRPSWPEVVGGLASKGPAFGMSVAWYAKIMLPLAPVPFAAAIAFSLALETFHGIFINTWQNLQNAIGRQRGVTYQTFFNLAYMQLTSAIARIITWWAVPATIAPWQWQYWRDMGIVTFVGTFVGTLGFQGLNDLYNKGVIGRNTRSAIQQVRDLSFLLAGVFFASGTMGIFWPLFIAQQTIDLGLFLYSHFAKARPIAYVADAETAASADFKSMFPVTPGPRPTPLRQAVDALINNPLSRLISWPFRKGWQLLKGGKK